MSVQRPGYWRLRLLAAAIASALGSCHGAPAARESGQAPASEPGITILLTEGTNMSAAVSPDGKLIVASIQGTLWSLPAGGGKAKALTVPELDAQEPAWSPD